MPSSTRNFDGVSNVNGVLPPDPNGAVGPNHYVQWVNLSFAVYSKNGSLLYGPADGSTLWMGFGGVCEFSNDGDPIVMHDDLADRWVLSQLAIPNFPFGPFYQCMAISQTEDPAGAYYRYEFIVNDIKLNDYPKFGVWPDGYYLAVNQFDVLTQAFQGQGVVAFEREKMLQGLPAQMIYFDLYAVNPNLAAMLPSHVDGAPPPPGAPNFFVQLDEDGFNYVPQDQLQLWKFHADWADPAASIFTGPAILFPAPFDSDMCGYARNCIPQPGTPRRLDSIPDRLMYRLQYRNFGTHESLVVNHTVDVGGDHAGVRWYELRDPNGTPVIHQQGTYAPDSDHRWMGSIAMDSSGNIALGFSVSSSSTFPSIRYAGRLAGDPPGVMAQGETELMGGSGSQTDSTSRWGDYSSMSVDPTDQCTFWYTQEYYSATSASGWRTRVGAFKFPSCATNLPFVTITATSPSASEAGATSGEFTVSRAGSTASDLLVTYSVSGSATPGADYVAIPSTVTIPAGFATVTIPVTAIDDPLVEPGEAVIATLVWSADYSIGTPSSGLVAIVSDDLPPDLVVSSLSVPSPNTTGAGATISVSDTTRNQGGGAAQASITRFYLSSNPTLDGGDVSLAERAVGTLAPGSSSSAVTPVTIPAGTASGIYHILAKADADDLLPEGQEGNNSSYATIQVGPDMVVPLLTVPTPNTTGAGATITVTDNTRNQGGGTSAACVTRFYFSTNPVLDGGDLPLNERAIPALAPGATSPGSTPVIIPAGTAAGIYYIMAKADADLAVGETQEGNNTGYATIQVGPDLIISALAVPTPNTTGAGSTITVTDTTRNQGGGMAAASVTRFYLSTNPTLDAADVPLAGRTPGTLAPGTSSQAATPVTIPAGTASGVYYILAKADADAVVGETQEGNNTSYATIQVGPDLLITALSVPSPNTTGAGATINVTDTIKNQGGGAAAASSSGFYLSTNPTWEASDVLLAERSVAALTPGATQSASTPVTIPSGTAAGVYYILARADAQNLIGETQEGNNVSYATIQVGPDLVVQSLTAPTPNTVGAGATFAVTDTTRNQGGGAVAASTTRLYLSTNTLFDPGDTPLAERAVPALAPATSSSGPTAVTIPAGTSAGVYYILAKADADNLLGEIQEGNNVTYATIQVGADLVISSLTVPTPNTTGAGASISVTDTTRNQGGGAAAASITRLYLSTNTSLDAADVPLADRAVPALAPAATSSGSTSVTIPAGTSAGVYYIVAKADADNALTEIQEGNNAGYATILVGSDLVISSLTAPSPNTTGAGATINVNDTTRNQGGGAAAASVSRFYLSTNPTLDAGDIPLAERAIPALAPATSSAGSTPVTIPAGTVAGIYYILAKADADNLLFETQEGNNTGYATLQIGPDLIISAMSVPTPNKTGAGETIPVNDTTRNQGGGTAAASITRFYLSTNPVLDGNDVLLTERAVPALAPGAISAVSTPVAIPAGTAAGIYYILARADADAVVGETQEGNNVSYATIQIGPDLIVTTLTVPSPNTVAAGAAIMVTDTTRNQGGGAAAASTTRFYLSTNPSLDAADVPLIERAVAALAAGATSSASTAVTIPAGTATGVYYILAKADADNAAGETQEGNNTSYVTIQVTVSSGATGMRGSWMLARAGAAALAHRLQAECTR
jgi:subtilase family serine protease